VTGTRIILGQACTVLADVVMHFDGHLLYSFYGLFLSCYFSIANFVAVHHELFHGLTNGRFSEAWIIAAVYRNVLKRNL
jgi:hypothetical protein